MTLLQIAGVFLTGFCFGVVFIVWGIVFLTVKIAASEAKAHEGY